MTTKSQRFRDYYTTRPAVYGWRDHLLTLMGDWDRILKGVAAGRYPGKVLTKPTGSVRESRRPCSVCKQPTIFTTDRGRSVHPNCEGWIDILTPDGYGSVLKSIATTIPLRGIKESPCLFAPVRTLAALALTDNPSLPAPESVRPADTPSPGT